MTAVQKRDGISSKTISNVIFELYNESYSFFSETTLPN